jgi:hypothetical protein
MLDHFGGQPAVQGLSASDNTVLHTEQLLECHFVDAVVPPHESTIAYPSDILRLPGPMVPLPTFARSRPRAAGFPGVQCDITPPEMEAM